jgi:type IV secretion/conjugal transfer VirB4 family ATPase
MLALNQFRSRVKGLPDLLNYAALVDDGVVLNKDGSLMAGWEYRGEDLESAGHLELAAVSARVNKAFLRRGSGWMIHVDAVRTTTHDYPARGKFADRTTALMDVERRAQYEAEGAHFETTFYLTATFLPPADIEGRVQNLLVEGDNKVRNADAALPRALETFRSGIREIEDELSAALHLRRLRTTRYRDAAGVECVRDELLAHLNACISGNRHPFNVPAVPMYLDAVLGAKDFYGGLTPRIGDKHIRCIAFSGFPAQSFPGILDGLNRLPMTYRWSNRFIFLDDGVAQKQLDTYRKKWFQKRKSLANLLREQSGGQATHVNEDANQMAGDAIGALAELSSGIVKFGYYTSTIVIMEDDPDTADLLARDIVKLINHSGFTARVESVNAVEAYLGSLPGNGYCNVRRPLMHTLNLADFLPLTSVWAGLAKHPSPFYPPDSPPLGYAATSGATPFRLNLHVGDVGHTLILGPTGAGKSTLLGFLMASHFRYPDAQIFAFDMGNSAFALCNGAGGDHYEIAGENSALAFYPLADIDRESERLWAADWLETLFALQGVTLAPRLRKDIHRALELLAASPKRTLTDLAHTLSEPVLRDALAHYTLSGSLGTLLDADHDGLADNAFQVFEMQHLMALGEKNVVPVMLYLFHRIERRLHGEPTLLVLDEAWLMLNSPIFRDKIREWLKTMRKSNAAVVFATQSVSDVMRSEIRDVVVESCPTKIFLPNLEARNEFCAQAYTSMGLTERQIDILASLIPKRQYLYMSPLGRRVFELGLGPVALSFIGASGREDLAAIRALMEASPNTWPSEWLAARGLVAAAKAWLQIGQAPASRSNSPYEKLEIAS